MCIKFEPLTFDKFVSSALFFHINAPRIHYYLTPDRSAIHFNQDKKLSCMVSRITETGFSGGAWHINKLIKETYDFTDFRVYTEPEPE